MAYPGRVSRDPGPGLVGRVVTTTAEDLDRVVARFETPPPIPPEYDPYAPPPEPVPPTTRQEIVAILRMWRAGSMALGYLKSIAIVAVIAILAKGVPHF